MASITIYPRLLDSAAFESVADCPWPPPWKHTTVATKESGALFGPYRLRPGATRRSNDAFESMTWAVFDVDTGTEEQRLASVAALEAAGVASYWYTSYSYVPGASIAKWRAIIPLAVPVGAADWLRVRATLADRFALQIEVDKCTGVSHAYYLPAHSPGASYVTITTPGLPWDPTAAGTGPLQPIVTRPLASVGADGPFPEGPAPEGWEAKARRRLAVRAKRYDEPEAAKRLMLERLLAGESIVDGVTIRSTSGDPPLARLCAILIAALHPLPLDSYVQLLHPTVERMQADGCKVPWHKVKQMLLGAARKKQQADADVEAYVAHALEYRRALFNKLTRTTQP